jgi:L-fuculose-phosphate aldolase
MSTAVGQSLREQVAWACRILGAAGYADLTLGHVSARGPEGEICIKRKGVDLETVLHTGVYRARPDVGAVVHGHPPYATALGATTSELEVLTHDGLLFADGVSRFGDPDLIVDDDQGDRVAAALGSKRAVLMENHGVLVVGADVKWAVLSAVTLERAARLQTIASSLGDLRPIGKELALELMPVKYREEFVEEYWAAWQRSVTREGGGPGGARL